MNKVRFKKGDLVRLKFKSYGSHLTFKVVARDVEGQITLDPYPPDLKEGRRWQWFTDEDLILVSKRKR